MAVETLTKLQPKTYMALGKLYQVFGAATAPRATPGAVMVAKAVSPKLLSDLRHLARTDLSSVEDVAQLEELLKLFRDIAALLERLLELQRTKPSKRGLRPLGTPEQIESVLEDLEDAIEDLELATNADVQAGIERLIAEVKSP